MAMFFFILCNRLGRNCHLSHATTTTYQTTRAVIKRQPGAAHVPATQNSRNNPSIRWARDVVFHYTTPRTVGSSLTKQWGRERSRQKLARLSGLSTDVRNDAGEMIPEGKKKPATTKKEEEKGCYCTGCLHCKNIQQKLEIYSLLEAQYWHLASQKSTHH